MKNDDIRLDSLVIYASDIEKTREFYECIGFQFEERKNEHSLSYYFSQVQNFSLKIYPASSKQKAKVAELSMDFRSPLEKSMERVKELISQKPKTMRLNLGVDGGQLNKIRKRLEGKNIQYTGPINLDFGYLKIETKDPEGNEVQIVEY